MKLSSTATGFSLLDGTLIFIFALSVPPLPSDIVYVNEAVPLNPSAGVNITLPSLSSDTVPSVPSAVSIADIFIVSPSASLSFAKISVASIFREPSGITLPTWKERLSKYPSASIPSSLSITISILAVTAFSGILSLI